MLCVYITKDGSLKSSQLTAVCMLPLVAGSRWRNGDAFRQGAEATAATCTCTWIVTIKDHHAGIDKSFLLLSLPQFFDYSLSFALRLFDSTSGISGFANASCSRGKSVSALKPMTDHWHSAATQPSLQRARLSRLLLALRNGRWSSRPLRRLPRLILRAS